jgi:hypothetical protein
MPQLPSGRHAALSADYALALARQGNFPLSMAFVLEAESAEDIAPLVNVIYFRPIQGKAGPGEPYPSGLMLPDVGTDKCDWSADDVAFFKNWLASDVVKRWLQNTFDELAELVRTVKAPLPKNLHGILEDDD